VAAIYAAADPALNIWFVIVAATLGSIVGGNAGYWIGKHYAYGLLVRYGKYVGMSVLRVKVGQYLFRRHGGKVVFFGRFVALLRILAAFLARVNHMPWRLRTRLGPSCGRVSSGSAGTCSASSCFAFTTVAIPVFTVALAGFFLIAYLINRYEHHLVEAAERELPGPPACAAGDNHP